MITIWGRTTSVNVQKVLWALDEAGQKFIQYPSGGPHGGLDSVALSAMNPNKLVPILSDEDLVLFESNAIVRYIANRYAGEKLQPGDAKARAVADMWMEWYDTTLYPAFIDLFAHMIRVPFKDRKVSHTDAKIEKLNGLMTFLDEHLKRSRWVAGPNFTMGDVAVGVTLYRYFTLEIERPQLSRLENYYSQLLMRPGYASRVVRDYDSLRVPGAERQLKQIEDHTQPG